jgi:hypothetical protein
VLVVGSHEQLEESQQAEGKQREKYGAISTLPSQRAPFPSFPLSASYLRVSSSLEGSGILQRDLVTSFLSSCCFVTHCLQRCEKQMQGLVEISGVFLSYFS